MNVWTILVASLYITNVFGKTFYSCNWITSSTVDCSHFQDEKICANNRVTYNNKCEFSQAHCQDTDIDLLHQGACTDADGINHKPVTGSDVVMDFFCTQLSHRDCPTDVQEVCGSNNGVTITFINACEYEKYKCTHQNSHLASFGKCP